MTSSTLLAPWANVLDELARYQGHVVRVLHCPSAEPGDHRILLGTLTSATPSSGSTAAGVELRTDRGQVSIPLAAMGSCVPLTAYARPCAAPWPWFGHCDRPCGHPGKHRNQLGSWPQSRIGRW